MDIRRSFLKSIGRLRDDDAPDAAPDDTATENEEPDSEVVRVSGQASDDPEQVQVPAGAEVAVQIPGDADVDPENIESGLTEAAAERAVIVQGSANDGGSATVNPVACG